jgi:hypothetical protein
MVLAKREKAESYLKRQINRNKTGRNTVPPGNLYEQLLAGGATDLRKTSLWPTLLGTPKAQDSRAAMRDRGKHNMGEQVQEAINTLLPTPRVSEVEGAPIKNAELKNGRWSRVNQKGVRFGVKVKDVLAVLPTPRAANPGSRPNKKGGKILNEEIGKETGLKLQPSFVEWMMGYPQNWTNLNYQNHDIG